MVTKCNGITETRVITAQQQHTTKYTNKTRGKEKNMRRAISIVFSEGF